MKKPMLLSNDKFNLKELDYSNMFISIKRDGVRAEVTREGIKNRSLKILRNPKIQAFFKEVYRNLPNGVILEAEIYADGIPCREMAGICNSSDKEVPTNTKLYVFGFYHPTNGFETRYSTMQEIVTRFCFGFKYEVVEQQKVESAEEVERIYNLFIEEGYEGAVLMDGRKQYKEGRVTIKQHIGFKLKPSREDDLLIIGVNERVENTNESMINELGLKYKRNTVDNKQNTGIAATFLCEYNNTTTKVTIGGTEEYRRNIWNNKENYIGAYAVVESMDYGVKDRLRHAKLLKIKENIEK